MTQLTNKTTRKTIENLNNTFDFISISSPVDIENYPDDVWKISNKQKFKSLLVEDISFEEMLNNQESFDQFKNDLLKLKNYSSRNNKHEEISLMIIKETKHKRWIRNLS